VREPNISDWRRKTFGDLTSLLRFGQANSQSPVLPDTDGPLRLAKFEAANLPKPVLPEKEQAFPKQESGKRKRI
jgi:phospholipase C